MGKRLNTEPLLNMDAVPPNMLDCFLTFFHNCCKYFAEYSEFKSNLDRSDAFTPFAPSHTVQATFIAHGVPWEESFIVNVVISKIVLALLD